MDDGNTKKPLRQMTNKTKDIYNTYFKHESGVTIPTKTHEEKDKVISEENLESSKSEVKASEEITKSVSEIDILKEEILNLQLTIENLEREKKELYDNLLRKAADFENFRKRTQREKEEIIKYGNEKLLLEFLPLFDDLGNAVQSAKQNNDYNSLTKGLELIWNKARKILEQVGVTEIPNPVGQPFDVEYHEALMTAPSQFPEGFVVQELQKGYKFLDKVLRHTKVVTSSGQVAFENEKQDS